MSLVFDITTDDGVADIEQKLRKIKSDAKRRKNNTDGVKARISSDRRASYFKDIWSAATVATALDECKGAASTVVAWGLKDWSTLEDDDGFALSHPSIIAMQRGASVLADAQPRQPLDKAAIVRLLSTNGGLVGSSGARQRTVAELDPDLPVAARLAGADKRNTFFEFARSILSFLELNSLGRKADTIESPAKGTILEFLYELHSNGYEHGRKNNGARFLRLQKHAYPNTQLALRHANGFAELQQYISSFRQPKGPFNLVEASVSDFGLGIVDGFLSTFTGERYESSPRLELLNKLLHEQLSSKGSDPNAGLGIGQALAAAFHLNAFVSLRTNEFWLIMPGRQARPRMTIREGEFANVTGTHWQLLLPEPRP